MQLETTWITVVGFVAAVLTSLANFPQLRKAWSTRETTDLSLRTLFLLWVGLAFWIAYGVAKKDYVIILANSVALSMRTALLWLKRRYG